MAAKYNVQAFIRCQGLGDTGYNIHCLSLALKGETAININKLFDTIEGVAREKEGAGFQSVVKVVITKEG